ncbi:hypothetical protein MMC30_003112 [Trapelia coarctata]|nr:hypothetical protein [Trapelia coarctata]
MSFAASRSTQNLGVPATQNTAPIIEFRCLYTHDLRQKKKRWQDGMLRFHTFNRRIMVYDVPRNFIGDTHWREDEAVQDGDELRLDKGVLIQVGEVTGSTEQDLTELLEKRRPTQEKSRSESSPRSSHPPSTRSTANPLTQLRPKSLNALLGTPRGAYGRAILPNKSPFESRNAENLRSVEQERPVKRQKVDHGLATQGGALRAAIQPLHQRSAQRPSTTPYSANSSRNPILPRQEIQDVISIDSDDDAIMSSSPAKMATPNTSRPPKAPAKPVTTPVKANKPAQQYSKAQAPTLTAVGQSSEPSKPSIRKSLRKDAKSSIGDSRPVNPLRLSSSKARKKLMYRELLPQPNPSEPAEPSDGKTATNEPAPPTPETTEELLRLRRRKREQRRSAENSNSDEGLDSMISHRRPPSLDKAEMPANIPPLADADPMDLRPIQSPEPFHQNKHPPNAPQDEPEESLFLTQETPSEIEAAAELARMDEVLLLRRKSDTTSTTNNLPQPNQKPIIAAQILTTNDPPPPLPPLPKRPPKSPSLPPNLPPPLTTRNPPAHAPPKPIPLPPNPRRSPLRKSLSESGKGANVMGAPSPKVSLQRAVSDTAEARSGAQVTSRNGVNSAVRREVDVQAQEKDRDTGPWSREAFDLFGWREGDAKGAGIGTASRAS